MHKALLFVVCLLSTAATAGARDIFVNNVTGDDRRGGTLANVAGEHGGPCRSIAKALRIAAPGDRIIVANTGQPYRESITLQGANHCGTDRFPFTIVGNGAVLDGRVSLSEAAWEYVGNDTFRTQPAFMSYQQLFLNGEPAFRKQPEPGEMPKLAPHEWCLRGGWIYFRVDSGRLPPDYDLACCGQQVGITLYEVRDVIVEDLKLSGFCLDGVNCHDGVKRTDLIRIQSTYNGRSGISIGGASRVRIDSCAAMGNGQAQVRVEGFSVVELVDNALDATSAPALEREHDAIVRQ